MPQRERIATWPTGRANRYSARKVEVLAGARVLSYTDIDTWNMFAFDANGAARTVDLPAVANMVGVMLIINNITGITHAITVRDAAAATIVAIPATKGAIIWCDGVAWRAVLGA